MKSNTYPSYTPLPLMGQMGNHKQQEESDEHQSPRTTSPDSELPILTYKQSAFVNALLRG